MGAVNLWDHFLTALCENHLPVWAISGNHDSAERLAFGGRLLERSGVHLASVFSGRMERFETRDEHGPLTIWALPFVRPAAVRAFFPDDTIENYTDAAAALVRAAAPDAGGRNILIAHQFVTAGSASPAASGSELLNLGTLDNVDASAFDLFDYVALGHIHGPQSVGRETVRYCGTPLKYSFSEVKHHKSVTVVELEEKGNVSVLAIPLTPLRDMVELRGTYEELTFRGFYEGTSYQSDYVHIILTDEEDIPDAVSKLRIIYPYLMKLDYDNKRTRASILLDGAENIRQHSPLELLEEFYEKQNGQPMGEAQRAFAHDLIEKIWEEEV